MTLFEAVLAENGRLQHVEKVAKNFIDLTMAHRGEVKAIVTTVIVSSSSIMLSYFLFLLVPSFIYTYDFSLKKN